MNTATIAVVDYGMGNLRSVAQAVQHAAEDLRVNVLVTSDAQDVRRAGRDAAAGNAVFNRLTAATKIEFKERHT